MTKDTKKGLLIGAGIAGPAMALQLKKIGIDSLIAEARNEAEMDNGLFMGITPNGLNVLKDLIDIRKLKEEYTPGKMVFYNAKGKSIAELDTKDQHQKYGAETIQIKRSRLSKELRAEANTQGIQILYGCRVVKIVEAEDKVIAHFENGRSYEADFMIACDGVHSICRQILFPDAPRPVYTRQLSTGAIVTLKNENLKFGEIKMIFGKQAFFAYAVSNQKQVWWFNNFYREHEPSREQVQTTLQKEIKDHLLTIHKNDPEPICEIIRQTDDIFAYPIYQMYVLPKWYARRICLIGDAAHATAPHIGQGASLALEDTVVLTDCLKKYAHYADAFEAFQRIRKPRVEKLIRSARKIGNNKSRPNPVATFFRDILLKYFIRFEIKKMDWVYGYNAKTVEN